MYPPPSQPSARSPSPPCTQLLPASQYQYQRPHHPPPPAFMCSPTPQHRYPHSRTPWANESYPSRSPSAPYETSPPPMPSSLPQYSHYPSHSTSRYQTPNPAMWAPTAPYHPPRHSQHSSRRPEEAYHTDHYQPPPRTPEVQQHRALPTPGDSGGSASPKSGSEVYMQRTKGKAPMTTVGNKMMSKLDDILKQLETSNERMQALEESNNRNRDRLHDLHVMVKSLPTKAEVVEELEVQLAVVFTAFQEQPSILLDKLLPAINIIPAQARALLIDDIKAERELQEPVDVNTAISSAVAPLLDSLDDLVELRTVLASLKDLPEAVQSVFAFRAGLNGLRDSVAGVAERIGVPASQRPVGAITTASRHGQPSSAGPRSLSDLLETLSNSQKDLAHKVDSIQERVQRPNLLDSHIGKFQMLADGLKDLTARTQPSIEPTRTHSQIHTPTLPVTPKRPLPHETSFPAPPNLPTGSQDGTGAQQSTTNDSLESRPDRTRKSAKKQKISHVFHPDPPMTRRRSAQVSPSKTSSADLFDNLPPTGKCAGELKVLAKVNAFYASSPKAKSGPSNTGQGTPVRTTATAGVTPRSPTGHQAQAATPTPPAPRSSPSLPASLDPTGPRQVCATRQSAIPDTSIAATAGATPETAIQLLQDTSSEGSVDRSLGTATSQVPSRDVKTYQTTRRAPTTKAAKKKAATVHSPASRQPRPTKTTNPRKARAPKTSTVNSIKNPTSHLDSWLQTPVPTVHSFASPETQIVEYGSLSPTQRSQAITRGSDSQDVESDESRITPLGEAMSKMKKYDNIKSLLKAPAQSRSSPSQSQPYTFAPETYMSSLQSQQLQATQMSPNEAGGQGGVYWSRSNSATSSSGSPRWDRQMIGRQRDDLLSQFD